MKLESLNTIFNDKIFRIPDYQRGYSWGESQLEDLWRDIEILEVGKDHYTGMLSVKFNKENIYYVIDGQQRIATLIILIKIITDKFKDNAWLNGKEVLDYIKSFLYKKTGSQGERTEMIFGYEVDNPSHIYFKTEILNLENTDDSTPENTLYTKNLNQAKIFFEKKIKDLNKEKIEVLLKKITENLKFNFYEIEDDLNEFVAFETMNNRGKPLSTLELLKNRLIYLSTLLLKNDEQEKADLRNDINNAWKTIYEYLGKNPKNIIKDDDFLQNHCFMYFKFDKNINKKYKDFLLKKRFTAEELNKMTLTYSDIKNYVSDIQISAKHYYFVHNAQDSSCPYIDKERVMLSKLGRLGFQSLKPLIVTLFSYDKYKSHRLELLTFIEKYIFTRFNIEFFRSGQKSTDFYHFANKFHKQRNANSKKDTVHLTPPFIKEISYDFEIEGLYRNISKKFTEKINDSDKKFYDWKGLKYFLYEYELSLQNQKERKVEWEHVNSETIEHIYPQTPDDESWTDAFQDKELLHDLGNLLLLSKSTNSSLKNNPFNIKKERFSTDSYSAIQISKSENWTSSEVLRRREKMLNFLDENWDIKIKNDVLELLGKNNDAIE